MAADDRIGLIWLCELPRGVGAIEYLLSSGAVMLLPLLLTYHLRQGFSSLLGEMSLVYRHVYRLAHPYICCLPMCTAQVAEG